jgi:hypothetical protein
MNALQQLSGNMNVFVNFFNSINRIFCQIRWLDRNLRNSSGPLLLIVGGIVFICYLVYASPEGGSDGIQKMLVDQGPLVVVCGVVLVLFYRRYTEGGNSDTNISSVMFGNPANNPRPGSENDPSSGDTRGGQGDIEMGTKVDHPNRYVQPAAVKY